MENSTAIQLTLFPHYSFHHTLLFQTASLRLVADAPSHCGGQGLYRLWSGLCLGIARLVVGCGRGAIDPQGPCGGGGGAGGDGDLDGTFRRWVMLGGLTWRYEAS